MNPTDMQFSALQRALHWLMAICIVAMLFIGVGLVSTIRPDHLTLVSIHKPLGIAILVLALFRLVVRLRRGAPPLPESMPQPLKLAAHLSHLAFYALMIALPLLGWGMLSAGDYPVVVAGVHLPSIAPHSNGLHTLLWNAHWLLAFCFFALIVVHIAAALFHALVRRDGVFEAMSPWREREHAPTIAASPGLPYPDRGKGD
jgi:cytochrome b561